jgi:hypothetical protein
MDGIKTSALFAALLSTICMTAQAEVVKVGVAGPLTLRFAHISVWRCL